MWCFVVFFASPVALSPLYLIFFIFTSQSKIALAWMGWLKIETLSGCIQLDGVFALVSCLEEALCLTRPEEF